MPAQTLASVNFICIQEGHAAARAYLATQTKLDVELQTKLVQGDIVAGFDIGHYTSGLVYFKFVQLMNELSIQVFLNCTE